MSRGSICFAPLSVLPKRKSSFTNAELRLEAVASRRCQRRYAFQSASGTEVNIASAAFRNSGFWTLIVEISARPSPVKKAGQLNPGAAVSVAQDVHLRTQASVVLRSESLADVLARQFRAMLGNGAAP